MTDERASASALLEVRDLRVSIGGTPVLHGVDLSVGAGEVVGLVGESGGGKSMTARAVIGMLPGAARATGAVEVDGQDVLTMTPAQLQRHRGAGAAMCFQNPRVALSPVRTVGRQLADRLRVHQAMGAKQARAAAIEALAEVGIRDPATRVDAYPHEMSGGQCQRVMIALALACRPKLLLADEPTTGLDVTLVRGVLDLFRSAADDTGRGVLLISHDLASLTTVCDRVVVLKDGAVVESGRTAQVLQHGSHPYTRKLLAAVPDLDAVRESGPPVPATPAPLLRVRDVDLVYRSRFGRGGFHALHEISVDVERGESVGIVGESGSGKSTLARVLTGLIPATSGSVLVDGEDLTGLSASARRQLNRRVQMVFQDPQGSLSPRRTVLQAVTEPLQLLDLSPAEAAERARRALARTGLGEELLGRRPGQLSGGQAQRVGIARALVVDPEVVVMDEPTSALDVTVQAQVLDLVRELAAERTRSFVFISHDLATVRDFCDRVIVLENGRIVESGATETIFTSPQHPRTQALLAAVPRMHNHERS